VIYKKFVTAVCQFEKVVAGDWYIKTDAKKQTAIKSIENITRKQTE